MATKYVRETKAGKSISAHIILNKKGDHVATVQAHFSNGGTCLVNVWHTDATEMQSASAGGYGYDKFTSALSGMTIDGHAMSNHSERLDAPKVPKGRKLFPRDYKAPKGFDLANYGTISKETGNRIYNDEWIKRAYAELGISEASNEVKNARWEEVAMKARELESAWQASDDCESGYSDCYRKSGLEYLRAIGYRVISAI